MLRKGECTSKFPFNTTALMVDGGMLEGRMFCADWLEVSLSFQMFARRKAGKCFNYEENPEGLDPAVQTLPHIPV